jgi:aminomethyltransferase
VANVALDSARAQARRRQQLCEQVRELVVSRLELPVPADWISDDQPLFGRGLELDSLDALELSLGVDAEYGIPSYEDAAPMFGSVAAFVEHLLSREAAAPGAAAALAVAAPPALAAAPAGGQLAPRDHRGGTGAAPGYLALRGTAARFDLSEAGVLEVTGPGALSLLQAALARDVEFVTPEQSLMSLILGPGGAVTDLVTVYLVDDGFWLETAFGRCAETARQLAALQSLGHGTDAVVRDRHGDLGCLLVEGPSAPGIVGTAIAADLDAIAYGATLPLSVRGRPVIASRTGFTGEFGYKFFAAPADLETVRSALADVPEAGLDTLRSAMLEVRQPVLDWETALGATPLQAGYQWLIDITKDEFCGRESIVKEFEAGLSSRMIGFATDGPAVDSPAADRVSPVPAAGTELTVGGERVGRVVTAIPSPGRGDVLGLALVDIEVAAAGIEMRAGGLTVMTLAAPYVFPVSWSSRGSGIGYG